MTVRTKRRLPKSTLIILYAYFAIFIFALILFAFSAQKEKVLIHKSTIQLPTNNVTKSKKKIESYDMDSASKEEMEELLLLIVQRENNLPDELIDRLKAEP